MSSSSHSWRRCSREYGAPGDILFSTVAGAPPHVHSPQKIECFLEPGKDLPPAKCMPVSLSNSLIDPNIELPAISVREVDAVLSSLNSPVSSNVAPDELECKQTFLQRKPTELTSVTRCSEAIDLCSVSSPIPFISNYKENGKHFYNTNTYFCTKTPQCVYSVNSTQNSVPRRAFSLSVDKISESNECVTFDSGVSSCLFGHTSDESNATDNAFAPDERSLSDFSVNGMIPSNSGVTHRSKHDGIQILTLRPSGSARFLSQSSAKDRSIADKISSSKNLVSSMKTVSDSQTEVSSVHDSPLPKPQQVARDRSPFVSLDLATQPPVSSLSTENEAVKYREANLSVRIANQAQFFPSRSVGSLRRSTLSVQSVQPIAAGKSAIESSNNKGIHSEQTQRSVHVQPSSGDDRFRYACPHPRCGRRYQAELALLRHLHKYHCEPIELPHRRRPAPSRRLQRRPASEERSHVHLCNDPTTDSTLKVLQTSISVEDTVSGAGTIPVLANADNRRSSQPANSLVLTASVNGVIDATSSIAVDTNELHKPPTATSSLSVLGCRSLAPNSEPNPSMNGGTGGGVRRCIVLQSNGLKGLPSHAGRTNLVRSTSISHNFPQLVDVDASGELSSATLPLHQSGSPFRLPRLRSISGSVSSPIESPPAPSNPPTNMEAYTSSWHSPESRSIFASTPGQTVTRTPHVVCPPDLNSKLGTDESSHPSIDNDGPDSISTTTEATCPSCGFDLDESDAQRREWISGIRALTYSKTDSIACPMDGCAHVCSGRADLSAHLTASHFPEVQNQLVRLIFACPLKDCQTVCPDEVSFQAHFNRHLFGYLPGDLSGLFSSEPANRASSENLTALTPDTTVKSTTTQTVTSSSTTPPKIRSTDGTASSEGLVEQSVNCATSTPVRLSYPSTERRNEVYLNLTNTDTNSVPLRSASTEPHANIVDPSTIYSHTHGSSGHPQIGAATVTEPRALSDPSILVLRSPSNTFFADTNEDTPIMVDQDRQTDLVDGSGRSPTNTALVSSSREAGDSNVDRLHAGGLVMMDTACPTSITFDGGHVDLTDHRNLLSALDLIPDDILMELLKEDRPGMWGDASGPSNFTTYSAPHEWDSPNWTVPDESLSETLPSHSQNLHDTDSPSALQLPAASCDSLDDFGAGTTADASPAPSSTNWVPSPVVHETWSLAVANERPCPELGTASPRCDRSLAALFDCPSLVLSDLTAALILPEVERRLRAKHESSQHNRTNNTSPSGVSPSLKSTSTCPNTTERTHFETANSAVATSEAESRHTRSILSSGKRRRNASESSPTARYADHCAAAPRPGIPSKSGKHGSIQPESDRVTVSSETSSHNVAQKENKRSHGSMTHRLEEFVDSLILRSPSPPSQPLRSPLTSQLDSPVAPVSSVTAGPWVGKATSYQRLCFSPVIEPLDDSVFLCPTSPAHAGQRDLIDFGLHASPKHFGAQPKRRRRKLPKVYTVSSDLAPVVVMPNKANLPRRHSLVYCNLVPSAQSPH